MLSARAFVPEIEELIERRDFKALREAMVEFAPVDAAGILSNLAPEAKAVVFRVLPAALSADIFEYLPHEEQEELLHSLGRTEVAAVLNEMAPDDRTALLEELPGSVTRQLVDLLTPEERKVATALLGYPESSVGRLMTPDYVTLHEDWTIAKVIEHLRKVGHDRETINVLYVIDERGLLIDDVRLREVVLAPADARVTDLMDRTFVTLRAADDQEEALRTFERYDRVALPVVDSQGILVGIVTSDDILDVAREEATEDIQKLGGLEALEGPYLDTGFLPMIRKRGVWLSILFIGEMLTATAMGFFEHEIERAVVLALFIPLVISSGGNSGSQAASLIIRALAIGEVSIRDWWRVMRRELLAGVALGALLGSIGFLRITIAAQFTKIYGPHYVFVALTVFFALIGVVTWGTFSGSMLPIVLKRLGRDPAVSSAPFVATLVDVTGLIIYFSVAIVILRGRLL
jgi:magnesium transporter